MRNYEKVLGSFLGNKGYPVITIFVDIKMIIIEITKNIDNLKLIMDFFGEFNLLKNRINLSR